MHGSEKPSQKYTRRSFDTFRICNEFFCMFGSIDWWHCWVGFLDDFMKMGTNYLRQCESAAHAQSVIRKALKLRGTYDVSLNNIKCDYDGNYGTYFIENRMYVNESYTRNSIFIFDTITSFLSLCASVCKR